MPKHPQEPHLVGIVVDGAVRLVVRAMSMPEARDHYIAEHLQVVKLTPSQAFTLGSRGDIVIENAKPEYADFATQGQGDFWDGSTAPATYPDSADQEVPHDER